MWWVIGITFVAMVLLLGSGTMDLISLYKKKKNPSDIVTVLKSGFIPDQSDIEVFDKFENFIGRENQKILPWIKERTPRNWHHLILNWNYDWPLDEVLAWVLAHPDCDRGTAQAILSVNLMEIAEFGFDEEDQNILFFLNLCKAISERLDSGSYKHAQFQPFRRGMETDYFRALEISESHYLKNPDHYSLDFRKEFFLPV